MLWGSTLRLRRSSALRRNTLGVGDPSSVCTFWLIGHSVYSLWPCHGSPVMRKERRPLLLTTRPPDSTHALAHGFLALDVDGAGLARDPVDNGVGDGAVVELRMPCRRRELRAQYERPGEAPWLDGLLFAARSTSLI